MPARKSLQTATFLGRSARECGVMATEHDGSVVVRVPAGVRLAAPIVLDDAGRLRLDVHIGKDASAIVVLVIPPGGKPVVTAQQSTVAAGGAIHWQMIVLGGNVEQSIVSRLAGRGARSTIDVAFYATQSDRQRISAQNLFQAADGGGQITIKGVAEHKAHVVCNGMIDIGLQGRGTDTFLREEVLMLDPTARVDAVPGLEIKTNDVKASHSATVSRMNREDLFYFASRGIPEAQARRMFVRGFLDEIVNRIDDAETREHAGKLIARKYLA